jgi:rhodanese-related sulfurtransferase
MDHSPGFLRLVNTERRFVKEVTVADARQMMDANPACVLLDVREESEWQAGHAVGARHLSKGILERDIERLYPDAETTILMYCGGGYRSVLTASAARKLGYWKCYSIIGGHCAMVEANWAMTSGT